MALLHSTLLYIFLPWLYLTLLDSTLLYHGCIPLYFTLNYSTMPLLHSTLATLLHSTLLYQGSTSTYFTLHYFTMALQWRSQNTANARAQRAWAHYFGLEPRPRPALSRLQCGIQKQVGGSGGCSPKKF